jgi:hypothetical protein
LTVFWRNGLTKSEAGRQVPAGPARHREANLKLAMTDKEAALLEAHLRATRSYLEFGSGGSTFLAAQYVRDSLISVDSSLEWLTRVESEIGKVRKHADISLHHVDIGPLVQWGYPADHSNRNSWPQYSTSVWQNEGSTDADLYLIDGRFRVACFSETLVHARVGAMILIHDFESRPEYHVVKELTRRVAVADELSVFVKDTNSNVDAAKKMAEAYRYNVQ